jgi:peptidoglycan/LPS O-acetylase OafA/YrhL
MPPAEQGHSVTTFVGIQYLRGLAATLVVVYHAMAMAGVAKYFSAPIGDFGIDIFFVISGFIMWVTTERRTTTPGEFWLARVFRIMPLYWIFTSLLLFSILLAPSAFFLQRNLDVVFTLKSLFLIPAYNPDVGDITPLYTIGWTLIYEMFFYFVFGLSLFIRDRIWRLAALIAVFVSLVVAGLTIQPKGALAFTYTSPLLLEFLAGIGLGAAANSLSNLGAKSGFGLLAAAVILFIWGWFNELTLARVIAFGPASTALVAAAIVLEKFLGAGPNKFALLLGNASYSIYLAHPFAQRVWYGAMAYVLGGVATQSMAMAYFAGAIVAGVAGGLVCYALLEKPLLKQRHRLRGLLAPR